MRITHSITITAALSCAAATWNPATIAVAQPDARSERIVVPLSNPSQPAVLDLELFNGDVTVTGYDGEQIIVEMGGLAGPREEELARAPDRSGLRRIGNTSVGLTAEEQNNVVELRMGMTMRPATLFIQVPQQTSVKASTVNGPNLTVENVYGEHELSTVNGGITANDIGGSVVANSTNGPINASFAEIEPDRTMSFTTFNGFIDVSLPADTNANLRMSTNRGEILTDFDVDVQPSQTQIERTDDGGRFRVSVNQDVLATIGNGGPELRFQTFNGDIVIRSR